MKYGIISDIHGNLEALEAVLTDLKSQGITEVACLGDVVGYGANPQECLEIIRLLDIPCVKGNVDEACASGQLAEGLSPAAAKVVRWTHEQLTEDEREWLRELPYSLAIADFTIVHGSLNEPQRWQYVFDKLAAAASFAHHSTPVCFYGHTHVPVAYMRDEVGVRGGTYSTFTIDSRKHYFINAGSVGEPRDGDPRAAYVVYDWDAGRIELKRIAYDFGKAQQKRREAGL